MATILESLVNSLKPKAHDAMDAIKESWDNMIEQQNTWEELGYDPVESKAMLEGLIMDPVNWAIPLSVPLKIPARGLWNFLKSGKKIKMKPSDIFQWPKKPTIVGTVNESKKTIRKLGFRNFDDFEDWMILKAETDKVFAKSIGKKQREYFKWKKEYNKKEKLKDLLLPKNIKFEDIMKTKNPLETYKKAIKAGNPNIIGPRGGNYEAGIKEYLKNFEFTNRKVKSILKKEGTKKIKE